MSVCQRGSQLQPVTAPIDTGVRHFTSEELSRLCLRHNAHVAYRGKVSAYNCVCVKVHYTYTLDFEINALFIGIRC